MKLAMGHTSKILTCSGDVVKESVGGAMGGTVGGAFGGSAGGEVERSGVF